MLLRCRWVLMTALLILALTAHSKNATPVHQPGAPPPPQILQIYREFWKPGSVAANRNMEAEASQICVELKCPHPYLGLESLTGPKEAWFLNGYVSSTEQTQVGEDYQKNPALIQALNQILVRKKPLSKAGDVNVFAQYQQSLSHGAPWSVGEGRFLVITVIKGDLSARSNSVVDGSAFEADDGTRFVISAARTRQEADARAAKAGRETRVFAVRPYWSLPAKDWIALDPSFWRHRLATTSGPTAASDLALVGAKIYPSPSEPPIDNGSIIVHDGRILALGPSATIKIPRAATVIDCKGLVVTAGFWNSHVHIMSPGLLHAEKLSPEQITSQLEEMLTRWGFTTVFDIGSVLDNTTLIRRRIESGEVKGPRILTVGEPFWAKGGTPIYVRGFLDANHISIPEVESGAQATERVRQQVHGGADGIKIFTGSAEGDGILIMSLELARAIVAEAHRAHEPVFAHPSNLQGLEVALKSGVDILAHTTANGGPWSPSLVENMKSARMALIPTLTLWHVESKNNSPEEFEKGMNTVVLPQLRAYSEAGGQILFGTDVGYIEQFDTSEEFVWMSRAGMSFEQILASLTTNPAQRFGYSTRSGRIAKGMDGDLVILSADPAQDLTAFSKVRYTIREGKVIY